ncbi:MAG: glycosyltransferase family 9 protein [Nitrososphaerales archaeon]
MKQQHSGRNGRQPLPGIRKIAVLRANAIGDFIFALPALDALDAAYPEAEIVLLGQPWHKKFLTNRPGPVDRVVVVPRKRGVREDRTLTRSGAAGEDPPPEDDPPEVLKSFFEEMRAERFDLALQMHGGGRNSNPFLLQLGARLTAGSATPDAPRLDYTLPYIYWQHEIARLLEVVGLVGAAPVGLEPRLALTEADFAECYAVWPETGEVLVAMHPGVGDSWRQWPPENFAAVGDALAQAGACILLTGAGFEEPITKAVADRMRARAVDLSGQLSVGGLAALLSRCKVVVSNDSGPLHVAGAVGVATVGIYWAGNLITAGALTRGRHRPHLSWRMDCPLCGRNTIYDPCEHRPSFVDKVQPEEVIASALELLSGPTV